MTEVMVTEVPWEYNLSVEKLAADPNGDLYIAGYASNGNVDEDGEVMDLDSLRSVYKQYMENPVIKLMHDKVPQWKGAIGRVVSEYTDVEGIVHKTSFGSKPYLVIKLARGLPEWIYSSVKDGVYKGLSIGGKLAKKVGNRLYVKSWLETSLVDIPSAKGSFVEVLKAAGESPTLQEEEPIKESEVISKFLNSIQETTQAKKLEEASTGINSFLKGGVGSGIKGHTTYHSPEEKYKIYTEGKATSNAGRALSNQLDDKNPLYNPFMAILHKLDTALKAQNHDDIKELTGRVKEIMSKAKQGDIKGPEPKKEAAYDLEHKKKAEEQKQIEIANKEEAKKQAKRERAAKRRAAKKRREDLPTHTETIENGKKVLARIREGAGGETGTPVGEGPGTSKEEERKAKRKERAAKRREMKKNQSKESEPKKLSGGEHPLKQGYTLSSKGEHLTSSDVKWTKKRLVKNGYEVRVIKTGDNSYDFYVKKDYRKELLAHKEEHVVVVDESGKELGRNKGDEDSTDYPSLREIHDSTRKLMAHHNHPEGGTLSGRDVLGVLSRPGMHGIYAHSPEGSYSISIPEGINRDEAYRTTKKTFEDNEMAAKDRIFEQYEGKIERSELKKKVDDARREAAKKSLRELHSKGLINYREELL